MALPVFSKIQRFPLSILIFGQKSCFLGPTIFKIPQLILGDSDDDSNDSNDETDSQPKKASEKPLEKIEEAVEVNQKTLNIVLRMRNPRKELNDIRFEYQPTKDTADGIAQELLGTGLIADEDIAPMAQNLQMIVSNPPPNRVVTFRVSTGFNENDVLDEQNLTGFAQLSLTD